MEEGKDRYECAVCGRTFVDEADATPEPVCCGQKMNRTLPPCLKKPVAEHYRLDDEDDACDEGREGKRE